MTKRAAQNTFAGNAKLLAKEGVEDGADRRAIVEKALAGLSIEQRIAVKAELARAGVLQ